MLGIENPDDVVRDVLLKTSKKKTNVRRKLRFPETSEIVDKCNTFQCNNCKQTFTIKNKLIHHIHGNVCSEIDDSGNVSIDEKNINSSLEDDADYETAIHASVINKSDCHSLITEQTQATSSEPKLATCTASSTKVDNPKEPVDPENLISDVNESGYVSFNDTVSNQNNQTEDTSNPSVTAINSEQDISLSKPSAAAIICHSDIPNVKTPPRNKLSKTINSKSISSKALAVKCDCLLPAKR